MRNFTNISRFNTNTTSICINGNSISIFGSTRNAGMGFNDGGCGCGGTIKK